MSAKLLKQNEFHEASKILKEGGIVAFPTETVFGLGVISNNEEGFERLVEVKRRRPDQPFTLMCSSLEEALQYCDPSSTALDMMKKFMPGPLTVLVKPKAGLPSWITLGSRYIGIRIPDSELVLSLIKETGCPLLVPSANKTGEPPLKDSFEVLKVFGKEIDAVVEGECLEDIPSTIIRFDEDSLTLIRRGKIDLDTLIGGFS